MNSEELLDRAFELTERLGLPLVVAAWGTVFLGAVVMAAVLRRRDTRGCWGAALTVGAVGLAAHLLDFAMTLHITPDLSLEANPIWRLALAQLGLAGAKAYGLTGKLLVSVLSAQLFAWYLAQRAELFPPSASGFTHFVRELGRGAAYAGNVRSFFSFSFALFGPYFFYVTLLNLTGDTQWADVLPGPIPAILVYFVGVGAAYFALTWRAFKRRGPAGPGAR
jgi:hypothetical protein